MDEYASLSHTKWDCKYHIVFIPKCRRKVLYKTGSIAEFVGEGAVEKTRRLEIPQEGRDFHFSHRACGEGIEQLGRTGRNEEPLNSSSTV